MLILKCVVVKDLNDQAVRKNWRLNWQQELLHDRDLSFNLVVNISLNSIASTVFYLEIAFETVAGEKVGKYWQIVTLNDADCQLIESSLNTGTDEHLHLARLGTLLHL